MDECIKVVRGCAVLWLKYLSAEDSSLHWGSCLLHNEQLLLDLMGHTALKKTKEPHDHYAAMLQS